MKCLEPAIIIDITPLKKLSSEAFYTFFIEKNKEAPAREGESVGGHGKEPVYAESIRQGLAVCFLDGKNYSIYHMDPQSDSDEMQSHYESYVYDEFFTSIYIIGSKSTSSQLISNTISWLSEKPRVSIKQPLLLSDKGTDLGIDEHGNLMYRNEINKAYLLLGSNIDKEKNIPKAIRVLRSKVNVKAVSSILETKAVGTEDQANFHNCAVQIDTRLCQKEIKDTIITPIEKKLKRVRTQDVNSARTIDIDIILFNNQLIDDEFHIFEHIKRPILELTTYHSKVPD